MLGSNEVKGVENSQIMQSLVSYRSLDFILGVIGIIGRFLIAGRYDPICAF